MTSKPPRIPPKGGLWRALRTGAAGPVTVISVFLLLLWYGGAVYLNAPQILDGYTRNQQDWTTAELVRDSWQMDRAVLPAPHQILMELKSSIVDNPVTSRRNLLYHGAVTLYATLTGFIMGAALGILLAVGIVYARTLDRSLLPWIIASQTVPILALAPMIIVVLGSVGVTGLLPKAVIAMYLCFFPVAVGMVKGLRSPDPLQTDLMRTYSASPAQFFWKLRLPASLPYLFASLKVAIALSLVGTIVGELPTGAQAGIGARLLAGSYYGQTNQIWAALILASLMSGLLVALLGWLQQRVNRRMGVHVA